ncbi:MAG: polysaccharide deacetylase family protein [Erysipelotrichaceae bacterium]|nr:polysaccharide deacetylase family protein [Erysipelotrichaceae bacterium]
MTVIIFCFYLKFDRNIIELKKQNAFLDEQIEQQNQLTDDLSAVYKTKLEELDSYKDFEELILNEKEAYYNDIIDLEQKILSGETNKKIAYLTFDDGPYRLSESFLDVLDEYEVRATFFYLMKCEATGYDEEFSDVYDRVYRRIISSGHTLGNHTASHKFGEEGVYQSADYFIQDLLKNRSFIYDRYGYKTTVMRFPGGSGTSSMTPYIIPRLKDINYVYVDWNAETGDGKKVMSAETYTANVLNNTEGKNILVVLMHDYSENTLKALPDIITGLRKQGYILLPLCNRSVACH